MYVCRTTGAHPRLLASSSPPLSTTLPSPEQAAGVPSGSEEGGGGAFRRRPCRGGGGYHVWGFGPLIWRHGRWRDRGRWWPGPRAAAEVVGWDGGAGVGERWWTNSAWRAAAMAGQEAVSRRVGETSAAMTLWAAAGVVEDDGGECCGGRRRWVQRRTVMA
uniref:Uncharacterized protein n=1 Tax=Oryza punctata TaxID=4537 RepID=A0A0E0KBD0_ORYPU